MVSSTALGGPPRASGPVDEVPRELSDAMEELARIAPELWETLRGAPDLETARRGARAWLTQVEQTLHDEERHAELDIARGLRAVRVLAALFGKRAERLSQTSTLDRLRRLAQQDDEALRETAPGFALEMLHLARAALGQSGIADGWLSACVKRSQRKLRLNLLGRSAALARSETLDELGDHVRAEIERHACGLDEPLLSARVDARRRILRALGGDESDWKDHRWHLRHLFTGERSLERLDELVALSEQEREAIRKCLEHDIPFGITPYYLSLLDLDGTHPDWDQQLRAQVIPPLGYVDDLIRLGPDRSDLDFMGEGDTSPISQVTRRYPFVAILKGLETCPQICVYCQRNWEISGPMAPAGHPAPGAIADALRWFEEHPNVFDVLVTGGDPMFLTDHQIERIMDRLSAMPHVRHVRWGSRSPVVMPMRITDRLAALLERYVQPGQRMVSVITHVESAAEVTPEMSEAVHRLRSRGISVYNQQVYTLFTSRRFQTAATRIALKRTGIDPYYTFYPKGKPETRDYTVPVARLLQERKEEARLLPGIFRTDEPVFNVPRLGKSHVRGSQDRELLAIMPDGRRVYLWHPWEKAIASAEPWLHADASVHEYLQRMEAMGEDPDDYASIWYYW